MYRRLVALCAALVMFSISPLTQAQERPGLAATVDVTHAGKEKWRVDYRFSKAVTSVKLAPVGDYRQKAWKILTPGLTLKREADFDIISFNGKPFKAASIEIATFDGVVQKEYAPFNRFTDGGVAFFLGHLQGDAYQGKQAFAMLADIRLNGLAQENVMAPPLHKSIPGGPRGYAYFGSASAVPAGTTMVLLDPKTPEWARETVLDVGAKMSQYYEQAYRRPLKNKLLILVSVAGFEAPGISLNGGALLGQLAYRFDGKQLLGDHPKKREMLTRIVAHEMAHIYQMNIERGGVGDNDPWIHEGGADAMALDGLLQTGVATADSVAAYRKEQTATCEKLGNTVDSYDGIYACGLVRFDKLGVGIVPLWRAMMQATEVKGDVYSESMINAIAAGKGG